MSQTARDTAVNLDNVELEGIWKDEQILLGFEVNVDQLRIRPPLVKQADARDVISDPRLNLGNRIITAHKIQQLRGMLNRWSYACRFWHYVASPIKGLLSFGNITDTWIRCASDQIWMAFWNLASFLRSIGETEDGWNDIFEGCLEQIVSLPKRVGGAKHWNSGDLGNWGCCDWEDSCF